MSDMSKKIYDLRKKQNKTLEDIANFVGVGKSTVRKWETGMIANMRRDKIAKLAKALNTTPAYLMGWTENDESESNNSLIADIIIKLRTDDNFMEVVADLYKLSPEQLQAVKLLLHTFQQ